MGFAEEVRQSRTAAPAAAPAAAVATEPAAALAAPADGDSFALPTGTSPVEGEVVVVEPVAKPVDLANEAVPAPIKIAGKEFKSVDEAMAYAEQLELASREDKAFKEGYDKASEKANPPAVAKTLDDEVEEMIFENPKEAIKKLREGIQKEIFTAYDKMTAEQQKATKQEADRQAVWTEFYKTNSDLADSADFIDFQMKKHWAALKDKPTSVALEELASIARKGLRLSKQAALPRTELQSKGATMAGASQTSTTSTAPVTSPEPLDFISQLNKLRKRGKQ